MNNQSVISQKRAAIKITEFRKAAGSYITRQIVRLLARTAITPNVVTWSGFAVSISAGILIIYGHLFPAGLVALFAGLFDMLDGALARYTGQVSRFGGVLDSTLDRLSEAAILIGIIVFYTQQGFIPGILLAAIALPVSLLVSYIRAKAEILGLKGEIGLFTRPERVVVLTLGLLLSRINHIFLVASLGIIILFSFITSGQRLFYVWQHTKD